MISVIVPTYNREDCLFTMLESINKQSVVDFEVIVVDQSETVSEEKVQRVVNSCKNLHYFQIGSRGRCLAKNFGMARAKGDVVLFCDDDIVADDNFLAEHLRVHSEMPEVGALSCHLIEPNEKEITSKMPLKITVFGRFVNKPNAIYNGYVTSLNGGNMSFKRAALDKIGYFEENFHGTSMLEEPDIAFRVLRNGYKIYFSSQSKVKHFPQKNGNIGIRTKTMYQWQRDFYFNQYFFMFRNKRTKYFPFIFTYLVYRTLVESIKHGLISPDYLLLSVSAFQEASETWKRKQIEYQNGWHTPKKTEATVLKYVVRENVFAQ